MYLGKSNARAIIENQKMYTHRRLVFRNQQMELFLMFRKDRLPTILVVAGTTKGINERRAIIENQKIAWMGTTHNLPMLEP